MLPSMIISDCLGITLISLKRQRRINKNKVGSKLIQRNFYGISLRKKVYSTKIAVLRSFLSIPCTVLHHMEQWVLHSRKFSRTKRIKVVVQIAYTSSTLKCLKPTLQLRKTTSSPSCTTSCPFRRPTYLSGLSLSIDLSCLPVSHGTASSTVKKKSGWFLPSSIKTYTKAF